MAFSPRKTITAGTKQFGIYQGHYYECTEDALNGKFYFDNVGTTGAFQVTATTTSTVTKDPQGLPKVADRFNEVWSPTTFLDSAPLVGQTRASAKAVTTAVDSGLTLTNFTLNMTYDSWLCLVVRHAAASQVMNLVISSDPTGATDTETFSFTTSSTADKWQKFKFLKGTGTTVGTVDYSQIRYVKVTAATAGTFRVNFLGTAPEEINFVGEYLTMNYDCIQAFEKTYTRDQAEVLCSQIVSSYIATKKSLELNGEVKETDLLQRSMVSGNSLLYGAVDNLTTVNATLSNTATLTGLTGLNVVAVTVNGQTLQRSSLATNVQQGYYNFAGGTITTNAEYANQPISYTYATRIDKTYAQDRYLKTGYVGYLYIESTTESGSRRVMIIGKHQINGAEFSSNEDGDTMKIMGAAIAANPYKNFITADYEI